MKTIKQEIAALHKIERQAQQAQQRLWDLEQKWIAARNFLEATAPIAWRDHCEADNLAVDYTFRDILA